MRYRQKFLLLFEINRAYLRNLFKRKEGRKKRKTKSKEFFKKLICINIKENNSIYRGKASAKELSHA